MADFEAGQAWVSLQPSAKGFSKKAKQELAAIDLDKSVDLDADASRLNAAIKQVKAQLKALDREKASPSLDFDASVAEAKIAEVTARLEALSAKEASPKVDVDVAKARQELDTLERQLAAINDRRANATVDVDIAAGQAALREIEAKLDEVNRRRAEPKVTADVTEARQRLTELDQKLAELSRKKATPEVELRIAQAQQEALRIRAELDRLGAMRPSAQVDADVASASAKLAAVNQQLNRLDGRTANVNVNADSGGRASLILMGVVAALGAIGAAAPAAAAALAAIGGAVGGLGQGIGAAMAGFSGVGDALKALEQDEKSAASSSQSSSNARAQGAKQVASAQRSLESAQIQADRAAITGAQQVAQAQQQVAQARQQQARTAASGAQQVADAERALAQASQASARTQITSAQQVASARRAVSDAMVSAASRVASAERSLENANRSRQYAQEALTRATQDAARANRDLQLSVSGGALATERAALSLQQARQRLAQSTSKDPLELADLSLSVREAEQQLKETQVRYGDLTQEQAKWARTGVAGSDQVVAAQRALQDSQRGVADAQRGLTEAQVSGARQVSDAQEALGRAQQQAAWAQQDAAQGVADAQRAVGRAAADAAQANADAAQQVAQAQQGVAEAVQQAGWQQQDAARSVADAQRALAEAYESGGDTAAASALKAADAMAKLTPAGRSMVNFLRNEWQPTWKRTSDAVADVMLPKVERAMRNLLALEPVFRAGMVDAGSIIGDLAVKGSQLATSPAFQQSFATIMASNNRQLQNYGDAALSLFGAFTDLFAVAGPVSERFSRLAANSMEAFESFIVGARASGDLERWLQQAADALMYVGGWIVDVVVDIYQFATALAPLGVALMEIVRGITDWVSWLAQLSPGLTSMATGAGLAAIAASKLGTAMKGLSIAQGAAGLTGFANVAKTLFNPAALAAGGALTSLRGGFDRAGGAAGGAAIKLTGSATAGGTVAGAMSQAGRMTSMFASALPGVGVAAVALWGIMDAGSTSLSEAAAGFEKGGSSARAMKQAIEEQNQTPIVGENWLNDLDNWMKRQMGITTTVEEGHAALEEQRSKMTNLEAAQSRLTEAQGNYELALRDFGAQSPQAVAAMEQLEARSRDVEIAQIAVREKTDLATAAMIWQRDEQLASLDTNLRKRQADSQLADAQQRLVDTIGQHGAKSKEAADAQLGLEMAQSRAAAAAKESAGGQQAYNEAIGKMVADTKGPLSETLIGLVRTLDGAGLAAAGAKVHINDAGVAVATFPDGKTVTMDAQTAPTFYANLQAAKAAVDSTKGTIGVDADPGLGEQKVGNFKLRVDQTTGVVSIDGNITPADQQRLGIQAKTDGTTGTMWINGNPVQADGALNGMRVRVDHTTGVMTIDGDPAPADRAGQGAKDGISNPHNQPVITPTVDERNVEGFWERTWRRLKDLFNPFAGAPAPGQPWAAGGPITFAHGGDVGGYASGGAISHRKVIGFPSGGNVRGPGTATSDSIPALLSNGEYVIRASAVQTLGVPTLDALNRMATGGPVGYAAGGRAKPIPGVAAPAAPAVPVPTGDPSSAAAAAGATDLLSGSMQNAAAAASGLTPQLAAVTAQQQSMAATGVAPLAGVMNTALFPALARYGVQVGTQIPLANSAMQLAQAQTQLSTMATAANTAANTAWMANATTGMSLQAQAQHAGLRAGQLATQLTTNQTAANTAANNAVMAGATTNMSAVSQGQHSALRTSQGQTVLANNVLAADTRANTANMAGATTSMSGTSQLQHSLLRQSQGQTVQANNALASNTAVQTQNMAGATTNMSGVVQNHLGQVRGAQGVTSQSTTAFADSWRDQLGRTMPDSGNPIRWVINFPIRSITDAWNHLDGQFALGKHVNPYVPNFATGGQVPGTGNGDTVPAMLTPGEYVISKPVVKRWGIGNINAAHLAARAGASFPGLEGMFTGDLGRQGFAKVQGFNKGGLVGGMPVQYRAVGGAIDNAVRVGQSMNGKRYVWGGNGPGGTDCCITGPVRVYSRNGAVPIEDISPGDEVFSYVDGKLVLSRVLNQWKSKTQQVYKVRTRNRAVTASANHPFMRLVQTEPARKLSGRGRGAEGWQRARYGIEWARLDELQRGDLLVAPRQMTVEPDLDAALPDGTPVDADVAWLIGLIVGDGTVIDRHVRVCVYGDTRDRADEIARARWGGNPSRNATAGLVINSKRLADALAGIGLLRRGADKRVPDVVWTWPVEARRAFLDGYCDADGHRPANPKRHGDRSYHSASRDLVEDVRALHIALGDPVSNVAVTERTKPIVIRGKAVKHAQPLHSFVVWPDGGKTGEARLRANHGGIADWLDAGDFTVAPVRDVTDQGVQDTYDIEVEDAHNFIADGIVVHNSGFVAYITRALNMDPNPYRRIGTTASFPWGGFRPGMGDWSVGNTPGSHMAGTLNVGGRGVNIESGGTHNTSAFGGPAVGADHPQFPQKFFLPQIGGQFVSGGGGGGSFDPTPIVDEAFKKAYREIGDIPKFFGPSDQVARDQGVARYSADRVRQSALDKLMTMFAGSGGVADPALANLIIGVGKGMGFPRRGPEVALATAMQESGLRNLPGGDRDSVGVFQQRPSMGWGSVAQIMNPRYSAMKFYEALRGVAGWEGMPHTVAAQRVQRSAFPDAYAKHVGKAVQLVNASGMYDNGGLIQPGRTLVENRTGMPERVLSNVETKSYDTLTQLVGKNGVKLTLMDPSERSRTVNVLPNAVIREKVDLTSAMQQAEFEVSRGSL